MSFAEADRAKLRALCLQAREEDPSLLILTVARRRILQHLADHGDVRFWPSEVLKTLKPYRRLQRIGYVEDVYDAERFVVSRITADGRAALEAASPRRKFGVVR